MNSKLWILSSIAGLVLVMVYGRNMRKRLATPQAGREILLQGGLADEERPRPCATADNKRLFCNKKLHGQEAPETLLLTESSANRVSLFSTKAQKFCVDRGEHIVCNRDSPYEFDARRFNNNTRIAIKGRRGWCVDKSTNIDCSGPNARAQEARFVVGSTPGGPMSDTPPAAPAPLPSSSTLPPPSSVSPTPEVPQEEIPDTASLSPSDDASATNSPLPEASAATVETVIEGSESASQEDSGDRDTVDRAGGDPASQEDDGDNDDDTETLTGGDPASQEDDGDNDDNDDNDADPASQEADGDNENDAETLTEDVDSATDVLPLVLWITAGLSLGAAAVFIVRKSSTTRSPVKI